MTIEGVVLVHKAEEMRQFRRKKLPLGGGGRQRAPKITQILIINDKKPFEETTYLSPPRH